MYQRFTELLEKEGKTVAQVSKETGIGQSTFSNWKNRNGGISSETLYKLALYFGVKMEYFMEGGVSGVPKSGHEEEGT